MVEQWSSKSHAWVRFLLSLLKKTSYNAYKTTKVAKKITNFYSLNKFQIFKKFKFFKNIFNNNQFVKFLFKKNQNARFDIFFFNPFTYKFLFLSLVKINQTTLVQHNYTSDFVFLNHVNTYQSLAVYTFLRFFSKFVNNNNNNFLLVKNYLNFLKFNYINYFLLLIGPDAFIKKKIKPLLALKVSPVR